MPQHPHETVTTEQLDLLSVAGHLDLDRLDQLQQRLDDMPASGRAVYAMNGIERSPAPYSISVLFWVVSAPDPGAERASRRAGCVRYDHRGGSGGPPCAPALGTWPFTAATSASAASAVPNGG